MDNFDRLLDVARERLPFANQIQAGIVTETLGLILGHRQSHAVRCPERTKIVEQALAHVAKHWAREIDFEALSRKSGVSLRKFRRLFQQVTGLPPQQYLLHMRLNEAKRLLGTMSVAEVAYSVGFADPLYFSRLFKLKVGVAPGRWH